MEAIFKYHVTETTEQKTKPETCSRLVKEHESTTKKKKTNKINGDTNCNKRRFSDEQIKSLESVFQLEAKLEPRKKVEVAIELGLQPRQVAIWFQNRRARWKSKQIEKEYKVLKANYDNLASCFESLKIERQSLLLQLEKLNELQPESIGKKIEAITKTRTMQQLLLDNNNNKNKNKNTNIIVATTSTLNDHDRWNANSGNEEERCRSDGQQQQIVMNKSEYADGSLVPLEKWAIFDLCGSQFDISCNNNGSGTSSTNAASWFNFWT